MKQFNHKNLIKKLGVITASIPFVVKGGEAPIFAAPTPLDWDITKVNEFLLEHEIYPYGVRKNRFFDVDKDSDLDIIVFEKYNKLPTIFLNNGLNSFDSTLEMVLQNFQLSDLYGDISSDINFADIDNDGLQDLIIRTSQHLYGYYFKRQSYFLKNSNTNDRPVYTDTIRWEAFTDLKVIDFDKDGDDDLLSIIPAYSDYPYTGPYSDLSIAIRFFENKGLPGVVDFVQLPDNPFGLEILETFLQDTTDRNSVSSYNLIMGDFDEDGDNDLFCLGSRFLYNDNDSYIDQPVELSFINVKDTFKQIFMYPSLYYNVYSGTAFNFDIDKDGDEDLIYFESNYYDLRYSMKLYFRENISKEFNVVTGTVFYDENKSGTQDMLEPPIRNALINIDGEYLTTNYFGNFRYLTEKLSIQNLDINTDNLTSFVSTLPLNYTSLGNIDSVIVALQNETEQIDVSFDIHFDFRSGNNYYLLIELLNRGNTTVSDTFVVKFDNSLKFEGSIDIDPISLINKKLTFSYQNLSPLELRKYIISFKPNTGAIKDTLNFWGGAGPISTDFFPENNISVDTFINKTYNEQSLIVHKSVAPKGEGNEGIIPIDTKELVYNINFFNNTSQVLPNILIFDTIDEHLDISTFKLLGYNSYSIEHYNLHTSFIQPNILVFEFKDTYFTQNGEGYITYAIKPKPITQNTIFTNSATAFYNNGQVAQSNTTINTIYLPTALYQAQKLKYALFPNPLTEQAVIRFNNLHNKTYQLQIFTTNGLLLKSLQTDGGEIIIERNQLLAGIYLFQLSNGEEMASGKFVAE